MIDRRREIQSLRNLIHRFPVVGILGVRQVGKTTLARDFSNTLDRPVTYFDLEDPEDLSRLSDPMLALRNLKGLVVIDEIQRFPDLFPVLRVLSDRPDATGRFLILGSASPDLIRQSSESLAGRVVYHPLDGFGLDEIEPPHHRRLWLRGGLPRAYLAASDSESHEWRQAYITTFLERDMPQLGITIRSTTLRRFWQMLAHYHAQTWNASEFARSFGVADTTVRNYLDILTSALVLKQLPPWFENISKRQIKAPKIYLSDSGLLHSLLNLPTFYDLEGHPKVGASWEGFVIQQIVRHLGVRSEECFYWGTHGGAELDLLIARGRLRLGFEVKRTSAPRVTPSMRHAIRDLKLERLTVLHAGEKTYPLAESIQAVAFSRMLQDVEPII